MPTKQFISYTEQEIIPINMNIVYEKCKNYQENISYAEQLLKPELRTYITFKYKFETE